MTVFVRKFLKKSGKILLSITAFLLVVVMVLQLVFTAAFIWLNASTGQQWIEEQSNTLLKESGFVLSLGKIAYSSLDGIIVENLTISDEKGEFANVDKLTISPSFLPLAAKALDLSIYARAINLQRMPIGHDQVDQEPDEIAPFAMPDIFFTSLSLDIGTAEMQLGQEISGQAITLSPDISIEASFEEKIQLTVDGKFNQLQDKKLLWLPQSVIGDLVFDPASLQLNLHKADMSTPFFMFQAHGISDLSPQGETSINLAFLSKDLSGFIAQQGSLDIHAALTGATENPQLSGTAKLDLKSLAEKGIGEIVSNFNVSNISQSPSGEIHLASTYKDKPVILDADIGFEKPSIFLRDIKLSAPEAVLSGQMEYNIDTTLADGGLEMKLASFSSYKDLFQADITGSMMGRLSLAGVDQKQQADLSIELKDIRYNEISAKKIAGHALVKDIKLRWPQEFDLQLDQAKYGRDAFIQTLRADLKQETDDQYHLTVNGNGRFGHPLKLVLDADIDGLSGAKPSADNIDMKISAGKSLLEIKGSANTEDLDLKAETSNLRLADILSGEESSFKNSTVAGFFHVIGPLSAPNAEFSFNTGINYPKTASDKLRLNIDGKYTAGNLTANLSGQGRGINLLSGEVGIPFSLSLYPFDFDLDSNLPIGGDVKFDVNLDTVSPVFLTPDHDLSGRLRADIGLSGTLKSPDYNGAVSLAQGRYIYEPYEAGFYDMNMAGVLSKDRFEIRGFSANDGGNGSFSISGGIGFGTSADTGLSLKAQNFVLMRSNRVNGSLNADMALKGNRNGYLIDGNILLDEFNILIPERFQSKIPELNIVKEKSNTDNNSMLETILIDVDIHAPDRIFVRGWGLDSEFGGNLELTGNLNAPQINGTLSSIRGRYEEFGKRFALEKANLRFQGSIPPSPYLDIEATTPAEDVTASVLLTGSAQSPEIALSSTPALPQDEILSRILFGERMERITPFQAVQLANTLQRFSGKGGSGIDPLGRLRSLTGVDDISVDTDAEGESTVGVGKYVTDKVYLEVERGKAENSGSANIEVEISPNISLESKIGQSAQGGAGVVWSRDY